MLKVIALLKVAFIATASLAVPLLEIRSRPGLEINPSICGLRELKRKQKETKRIVGGVESVQGSWPWQVALFVKGKQLCGGSLVNQEWIVTATHCFHDSYSSTKPKDWFVTLGEFKLAEKESFEQIRNVSKIILHPEYVSMYFEGIFDTPPKNDVALLRLSKPVNYDRFIRPICLLRPAIHFPPGKECYVTGWGHTKFNGTQPEALNEAKVKLVYTEKCNRNQSYAGKIHETALCAGFEKGGVDSCQYDSGGPLACEYHGRYYLTGIVSWGHGCASPHKYGVYANMRVLTPWVVKNIERNAL